MNDKLYANYLNELISKIFKILPMKEQQNDTVTSHISSIILELNGCEGLLESCEYDARLASVMFTLESLKDETLPHSVYKKEIFKCITLIEQIIKTGGGSVEQV